MESNRANQVGLFPSQGDADRIKTEGIRLSDIQREAFETAKSKGFTHEDNFPEQCMLVVTELAEAVECYRRHGLDKSGFLYYDGKKPEGIAIEMADVILRACNVCSYFEIPLEKAIIAKMAHNKTRPYRHGGKIV